MDNGEDWQKPNTFGEAALRSLEGVLDQLRSPRLARAPPHGQAVRVRRRRRHRRVRRDHARASPPGGQAGPRALRPDPRAAVRHGRGDQRGGARRRSRDRAPLRLPHDRVVGAALRLPRGLPRAHPGLGRDAARPAARRRRAGGRVHRREPPPPEPDAERAAGVRGRLRRRALRARRVPRRVARVPARQGRGGRRQAPSGGRSLGRRGGVPQGALAPRRPGTRRDARAVSRARPDRRRGDLVARGRLPRRGGRARRPPSRPRGAGLGLRVQPRRAPRETRRRDARRRAASRPEGRRRRRRAHGAPARAALPAPARGARRAPRPHAGAGRRGRSPGSRDELADLVRRGRIGEGKARFLGSIVTGGTGFDVFAGCDSRARGGLRGDGGEEGGLRRARARRLARVRPRDEHLVALRHRDGRRASSTPSAWSGCTSSTRSRCCPSSSSCARRRRTTSSLATAWAVTKKLAQDGRPRTRRAGLRRQPAPRPTGLGASCRRSTTGTPSRRPTRPCCGWACRWRRPSCSSSSARRSRTTCGTRCTTPGPIATRSRRRSRASRREATPSSSEHAPRSVDDLHTAVLEALADESRHILEDGVVAEAADIDTCLLLGAGFPFWLGGITKHLDQTGVSERVVGRPLAELASTSVT